MGAEINEVDYEDLIERANLLVGIAKPANDSVVSGYGKFDDMKNVWFGYSYDVAVNAVNQYVDTLNECFRFLVTQGPSELAAKAVSYSKGDMNAKNHTGNESPREVERAQKSNKAPKLRFQSSRVESTRSDIVDGDFKHAINQMDTYMNVLEGANWDSVAGESTKRELIQKAKTVQSILTHAQSSINGIITNQQNAINAIEGAAEAVEAGKEIVESLTDNAKNAYESFVQGAQEGAQSLWQSLTGQD